LPRLFVSFRTGGERKNYSTKLWNEKGIGVYEEGDEEI
jgi:hypothetical protein